MDPISAIGLVASAGQIVNSCFIVSSLLYTFFDQVRLADVESRAFGSEIQNLSSTMENMKQTLNHPSITQVLAEPGHVGNHFRNVRACLLECGSKLDELAMLLRSVHKDSKNWFGKATKKIKLDLKSGEIGLIRRQLQGYKDCMPLSIQMINLSLTITRPNPSIELGPRLDNLVHEIQVLRTSLRTKTIESVRESRVYGSERAFNTMEEYLNSSNAVLAVAQQTVASHTTAGSMIQQDWDSFSVNPGPLSMERHQSIEQWINPIPQGQSLLENPHMEAPVPLSSPGTTSSATLENAGRSDLGSGETEINTMRRSTAGASDVTDPVSILTRVATKNQEVAFEMERLHRMVQTGQLRMKPETNKKAEETSKFIKRMLERLSQQEGTTKDLDPNVYIMLAHASLKLGQREEAIQALNDALEGRERDPQIAAAHQLLAEIAMEDGNLEQAESQATKAAFFRKLTSGIQSALFHESVKLLVKICEAKGETTEAESWRAYLSPDHHEAQMFDEMAKQVDRLCNEGERAQASATVLAFLKDQLKLTLQASQARGIHNQLVLSIPPRLGGKGVASTGHGPESFAVIHAVSKLGKKEILSKLVARGADVNAPGKFEVAGTDELAPTPLHITSEGGFVEATELLLKHSAWIESKDGNRARRPLHWAASRNAVKQVECLVSHEADISARDTYGNTPLHTAAMNNAIEVARYLLMHGADVNSRDGVAATPLHLCAKKDYRDMAALLLSHGADPLAMMDGWKRTVEVAKSKEMKDLIKDTIKRQKRTGSVSARRPSMAPSMR